VESTRHGLTQTDSSARNNDSGETLQSQNSQGMSGSPWVAGQKIERCQYRRNKMELGWGQSLIVVDRVMYLLLLPSILTAP
jgi:hypothetical protein